MSAGRTEQDPAPARSIHASCVAIGDQGVLIRGASGAGKSTFALRLILDAPRVLPLAELVADDRVLLKVETNGLIARPAPQLEGLIEVRGLGIRRLPHRPSVALSCVVDLGADSPGAAVEAPRMPAPDELETLLEGHSLRRIRALDPAAGALLLAALMASNDYEN